MNELINKFNPETGVAINNNNPVIKYDLRPIPVVIAKPTKVCNADCGFCYAKSSSCHKWSIDEFKFYFDKLKPILAKTVKWVWHGGEPMMMGVKFYEEAANYVAQSGINVEFCMQSNIILYKENIWGDFVKNTLNGRVSTSYDVDETSRTIRGNAKNYNDRFMKSLYALGEIGVTPNIITTADDNNITQLDKLFKLSNDFEKRFGKNIELRVNYKINTEGKTFADTFLAKPKIYGETLSGLLEQLATNDTMNFKIAPLESFIFRYFNLATNRECLLTNRCAGTMITIETNGNVYHCDDFVCLDKEKYTYGNLKNNTLEELFSSWSYKDLRQAPLSAPLDCIGCEFYYACRGGCHVYRLMNKRFGADIYPYCEANKIIFNKLKQLESRGYGDVLINKALKE